MKIIDVIHSFLLALFPVFFLFSHNIRELNFSIVFVPAIVVILLTILLLILLNLLLKSYQKTAILVSVFWVFFFSYGSALFIPLGVIFLGGVYFVVRMKSEPYNLTKILNIIALCLILPLLFTIATYEVSKKSLISKNEINDIKVDQMPPSKKSKKLPDIYYIILDRYAGSTTLKNEYNFDNGQFTKYLYKKGFYVASTSKANYTKTAHSLASSLNMEYINYMSQRVGQESGNWLPLFDLLQNNKVQRFLKAQGYMNIYFGSSWLPTKSNKYADFNINYNMPDNFSYMLFQKTLLYPICVWLDVDYLKDPRKLHWETIQWQFKMIAEIPYIKGPKFVFAHLLIPHEPFVFDQWGDFIKDDFVISKDSNLDVAKIEVQKKYIDQLIFANKKTMELIDKLLARSDVPPIIIVQGDEGPFPIRYTAYADDFNWKTQATDEEIREKYFILNSFYLPGFNKRTFYPNISPVNTFRLIFNHYFNTHLEILPDEQYAHEDDKHPYKFINITGKFK